MRYGFIKAAAATPEIRVADCSYNAGQTVKLMREAAEKGVKLLVFPELCITGYTCSDLFLQRRLLDGALTALRTVMEASRKLSLLTVAGLPLTVEDKLYNCAAVIFQGEILGVVPKTNLPNYNEFYEKRHFVPAPAENTVCRLFGKEVPFGSKLLFCCDTLSELKVAVEICEDLWSPIPPSNYHALAGATIIANPSASNEVIGKDAYRKELVGGQSGRLVCGYIYASAGEGESTTDLVFSGHNLIAENGAILAESRLFHNSLTISELDVQRLSGERRRLSSFPAVQDEGYQRIYFSLPVEKTDLTRIIDPRPFIPSEQSALKNRCETILSIQSLGLKKRLEHSRAKTAVVGISGGLDSTLALCVTARAMDLLNRPRTDIIAITMPCFGTTQRTKSNAEILAQHLGVTLERVDIARQVLQHFEDIGHSPDDQDVTFENAQARTRTLVLMDWANQTGGLVIGTGDLSELALGWATYNGDHMSMYGVNASIPKTLIRHLVSYEAEKLNDPRLKEVLMDILDTPVSPELLPAKDGEISQKTEDLVGPYELHDFYLYYAIRWGFSPAKVYHLARLAFDGAYDQETILKWLKTFYRRFFNQQFKRSCLPDGPKVGSVTLSPRGDWRMPSDASSALWLKELDELSEQE